MPTATSFTAFGRGNGLESCISRIPLNFGFSSGSSNEMWTTLAGVNSNNPVASQDQIDESLRLAYKLLYNTYQFKGSCRAYAIEDGVTEWDHTVNDIVLKKAGAGDEGNNAINPSEPIDRVCNSASNIYITGDERIRVQANIANSIGLMTHNGQIDGNLMGYTIYAPFFSPFCGFFGNRSFAASANVSLHTTDSNYQGGSVDGESKNAFVQLGGMHFIAKCLSENGQNYTDRILEPENLLAQSRIQFTGGSGSTDTLDALSRSQITDIEFYTYN